GGPPHHRRAPHLRESSRPPAGHRRHRSTLAVDDAGAGHRAGGVMTDGLDIAFFASSLVSAYWNGAATYYRGIVRALAARGHRITFFEPDAYDRQQHRDIPDPDWADVVVYSAAGQEGVRQALLQAARADLVVKA